MKVFYPDGTIHWSAATMDNFGFDEQKRSFAADKFHIVLSDDNGSYHIKSELDPETKVDVKITRTIPGFKVGQDGRTNYGEGPQYPWGCIRHVFWAKAESEGTVEVKNEKLDVAGKAVFILALQGMKPHHAGTQCHSRFASLKLCLPSRDKLLNGISSLLKATA